MKRIFTKMTIIFSMMLLIGISAIYAQKNTKPVIKQTDTLPSYKSLFWMDENTGVEVYLIERRVPKDNFNLVVVSDKKIEVIYRTEINSSQAVVKELVPVKTEKGRNYYDVMHNFSRTTIWMALDFKVDGKKIDSLTRTFYDHLFEVVPNNQFLGK